MATGFVLTGLLLLVGGLARDFLAQLLMEKATPIRDYILHVTYLDAFWTGQFCGKDDELALANKAVLAFVVSLILYSTIDIICPAGDDLTCNILSWTFGNWMLLKPLATANLVLIGYLLLRPKRGVQIGGHDGEATHEVVLSVTNDDFLSMFRWSDPDALQDIKEYPPFEKWRKRMHKFLKVKQGNGENKFGVSRIEAQWVDRDRDTSRITGLKLQAVVELVETKKLVFKDRKKVPGIVLMSDPSVAVLMLVWVQKASECSLYVATVQRSRIAVPCLGMREIPSKSVADPENFRTEAEALVRGMQGFENEELIDMTELAYRETDFEGVYPTVGASSEYVRMFVCQKQVSEEEFNGLDKQLHLTRYGCLPFECGDMKAMCAAALYERLVTNGQIQINSFDTRSELFEDEKKVQPHEYKPPVVTRKLTGLNMKKTSYAVEPVWAAIRSKALSQFSTAGSELPSPSVLHRLLRLVSSLYATLVEPFVANGSSENIAKIKHAVMAQKFKDWESKLAELNKSVSTSNAPEILRIEAQSIDCFGPALGFFKFDASAKIYLEETTQEISGNVFMRGGSVGILVLLQCGEDLLTVVTRQARVAVGEPNMVEIPAGMTDSHGNTNFASVAIAELLEETGMQANDDLVDMSAMMLQNKLFTGYYPACDKSDEFNRFFLQHYSVTEEEKNKYMSKPVLRGNFREGEFIEAEVIPYEDLWKKSPDAKALCAVHMYETLLRLGKLPAAPRPRMRGEVNLLQLLNEGDGSEWFDKFDEDGNGELEKGELEKGLLQTFSQKGAVLRDGLSPKQLQITIDWFLYKCDTNNDNRFDRSEFKTHLRNALIKWTEAQQNENGIEKGDTVLLTCVKFEAFGTVTAVDEKKENPVEVVLKYTEKGSWWSRNPKTHVIGTDSFKENELVLIEKAPRTPLCAQ